MFSIKGIFKFNPSFTKFEFTSLTKIVDRLRWCVELMSQICEPKTRNYKKLLKLIQSRTEILSEIPKKDQIILKNILFCDILYKNKCKY